LCGYTHKNQRGLEVKIISSIGNDEEPIILRDPWILIYSYSLVVRRYPIDVLKHLNVRRNVYNRASFDLLTILLL